MEERRSLCIIWIMTTLGIGFLIVSCGTKYWQGMDLFDTHKGLWQSCSDLTGCSDVNLYSEGDDELNAVRACMILGIIFIALATMMTFLGACAKMRYFTVMTVFEVLAVGFCITAMSVYTHYKKVSAYDYMWSYILGWLGCGFYGGAVLLALLLSINK